MAGLKVGVLISGRGSNLRSLIKACAGTGFPAEIALVISNRDSAPGLQHARDAGINTANIPRKSYETREACDAEMTRVLEEADVGLVCLAGFMRLLSEAFTVHWRDRLLNIHPSLLPSFKGLDVHERVLEAGVRITGCTVQFVRHEMDAGPIIAQAAVPVLDGDTADTLAARVLAQEHTIYPLALRLFAERRLEIVDETVRISDAGTTEASLVSPAL
jgi:phosphoribosylglycinamide formyltransferase-1